MLLEIITPDKKLFDGEVKYAYFPGTDGHFGVLDNHAPMIATLAAGTVELTDAGNAKQEFIVRGGVVEISKNKIIVLAE